MGETNEAVYPLGPNGVVGRWLACGVVTSPIDGLARVVAPEGNPFASDGRWILTYWAFNPASVDLKMRLYKQLPPFTWQPGEIPQLNTPGIDNLPWRYAPVEEDCVMDFSRFNFTPTLMQGWLYAGIYTPEAVTVRAELHTIGPARVWLNGALHTHFKDTFSYVATLKIPLALNLKAGLNPLYLHGEMFGWREARLALGLRLPDVGPDIRVMLPLGDVTASAWHEAEGQLSRIQVRQFAFPRIPAQVWLDSNSEAPVQAEVEIKVPLPDSPWAVTASMALPSEREIVTLKPGAPVEIPLTQTIRETMAALPGENRLSLSFKALNGAPFAVHRHIWASANEFSAAPYGDYDTRRREAMEHFARMPYDVPSAIAALEMGAIRHMPSEAIAVACHFMENRHDCADFYSTGLLWLLERFGETGAILDQDRARIETAFTNFKFWLDEPGLDAMCYFTENHQILFHITAYLAGQRWPDRVFANSRLTGTQQKERARARIEAWILRRLQGSFSEWDSNSYMTLDAYAMLALVEFAGSRRLREMAETLLHKIFFMIACQSFRGTHGSSHGRCYVEGLKSAQMENTSNIQRIAWGMGIFNGETRAAGLLATARRYRVSEVIQRIGADVDVTLVTRARSTAEYRPQFDLQRGKWDVSTLTRRTSDYMLSAALDFHPGGMGIQEHLWQATLGPEAAVFTTYPGNSQEHGNARPNFWAGSARLPRVRMIDRTVLCLYRFEPGVGLGFSHAYFPTVMFDEYRLHGNWAFARVNRGFVALWGDGPLALTQSGRHAYQELRSAGAGQVWVCHAGSAREDGDFETFCHRLMQRSPQTADHSVRWITPQGDALALDWEGELLVNDKPSPLKDFPHYENAYTRTNVGAETMRITVDGQSLVLNLKHGRYFIE